MEKHKWYRRRATGPRKHTEPYDIDFKRRIVSEYLASKKSTWKLAREYGIPRGTLYNWIRFCAKNVDNIQPIGQFEASMHKRKPKGKKAPTKETLEEAQLKIEALETLIQQAEEHYKISIRKKSATKRSK